MKKILFALLLFSLSSFAFGQEKPSRKSLENLNIDFMLRGYFYAGSRIEDKNALGGFGPSENFPKAINSKLNLPQGKISLIALPDEETVFAGKYKGIKLLLVNATGQKTQFSASDSRLNIVQEALDSDGKWKPVEYLPSSWCGNSYHTVFLGANEYWEFTAARFTGKFKTKLRFRLDERRSKNETTAIYSNEFEGGINKEQFTNQRPYNPSGIMDPYNN